MAVPSATIPEYTPERAYMYKREREAVRAKFAKTCDISDLGDAFRQSRAGTATKFVKSDGWKERVADCAQHSGIELTDSKRGQINAVAKDLLIDFLEGERFAQRGSDHMEQSGYTSIVASSVAEIYVNHVTREGLSRLKSCGLADRSCVSLCGAIIKKTLSLASSKDFAVEPNYEPEMSTGQNVHRIENYWKAVRQVLNENHREEKNGFQRTAIR